MTNPTETIARLRTELTTLYAMNLERPRCIALVDALSAQVDRCEARLEDDPELTVEEATGLYYAALADLAALAEGLAG